MSYIRVLEDDYNCYNYEIKWWHFFIPTYHEINKLCASNDKTYLFLMVAFRTIFYSLIFFFLHTNKYIKYGLDELKLYGFVLLAVTILLSLSSLSIVALKKQRVPKIDIETDEKEKEEHIPMKTPKRVPKTEAEKDLDRQIKEELDKRADQLAVAIAATEARIKGDPITVNVPEVDQDENKIDNSIIF